MDQLSSVCWSIFFIKYHCTLLSLDEEHNQKIYVKMLLSPSFFSKSHKLECPGLCVNGFLNANPFCIPTDFRTESWIQLGWEHKANQMEA